MAVRTIAGLKTVNRLHDLSHKRLTQRGNVAEPDRTVGSVVRSDDARKRRVEQVTGLPFAFELAVA